MQNPSQNFCYPHSLNFHLSGSTLSVSKIPTQLIVQLNSSLWHIIVTLVTKFYNFDHNRKYFANVFPNDPDLDWSFQNFRKDRLLINFLFSECCKTQFIPSQMFYESWKCQRSCVDGWRIRISSKTTTKRSYSWVIIF